jgi:hypothetical protein
VIEHFQKYLDKDRICGQGQELPIPNVLIGLLFYFCCVREHFLSVPGLKIEVSIAKDLNVKMRK